MHYSSGLSRSWCAKAAPDADDLRSLPRLPEMADESPAVRHFHLRSVLVRGLMAGSLDAAEAVLLAEPAVEALALLVPLDARSERYLCRRQYPGLEVRRPEFEPCRLELLAVVAALLDRWIGDDPALWDVLLTRVGQWPGSFASLLRGVLKQGPDLPMPSGRLPRWPRGVDAANVLLAVAPPGSAEAFVEACDTDRVRRGLLTRMLDRGPLLDPLIDYALGPSGTGAMRVALARNPAAPIAVVRRTIQRDPRNIEALRSAYFHPAADLVLRIDLVRRADAAGGFGAGFAGRLLRRGFEVEALQPLLTSQDVLLVNWVLKRIGRLPVDETLRLAGYATLALRAGPEVVWSLEQERAGGLRQIKGAVRESMETGDPGPIVAAAEATSLSAGNEGTDDELSVELERWPYTELIREHVEGRDGRRAVMSGLMYN